MFAFTRTVSFLRPLAGSVLLLGGVLLVNACGTSKPTTQQQEEEEKEAQTSRTLRLTAIDSLSETPLGPLDSARAVNRTFGDSLRADSSGQFVLEDAEPALHVFDVSGYGYHTQRHVAVLVEPDDSTVSASTNLLRQRLTIDCKNSRPRFWRKLVREYKDETSSIQFSLSSVSAENGQVTLRPVVVNSLIFPIYLPDNFGALGPYAVDLYDGDGNRLSYTYKNAPPDEGQRIYKTKADIPEVPPGSETRFLKPSTLIVGDSIEKGTTIQARMRYTFSLDDTLETTSATTFPEPETDLDSLQTPVFDTLRTAGEVRVADSLVLQRDTTTMRIVGIDTTITRRGYTLFSTRREGNVVPSMERALNLLYVPDSVITRARRDSLEALAEEKTTVPEVDTTDLPLSEVRSPTQIVERTNTPGLRSLLADERLSQAFSEGLPTLDMTADSLLSFSATIRGAHLQTPSLSESRVRRGLDAESDSVRKDSVILSAPASDSLFRTLGPVSSDTTARTEETNPFILLDPSERLAPDADSITIDSLGLTTRPDADSVATTSIVTNTLSNPPSYSYWYAPPSQSRENASVLVVDSSFFRLRAKPHFDTTSAIQVADLLPDRVGIREQVALKRFPQQVLRAPRGTYRQEYLKAWRTMLEEQLQENYCEIFPFPMETGWRRASMY